MKGNSLRSGFGSEELHHVSYKAVDRHRRSQEWQPGVAFLIYIQHVVDHSKQQVDRQLHVVPPLSLRGRLRSFVLCKQLQRLLDPHQRITNIVGEHRGKLTERGESLRTDQLLFETLLFGEV